MFNQLAKAISLETAYQSYEWRAITSRQAWFDCIWLVNGGE